MNEHAISLRPLQLGLSLGTTLVLFYLACLALSFIVPDRGLHQVWLQFLYGFTWTMQGILVGLVETFVYGMVSGSLFAAIYNAFDFLGNAQDRAPNLTARPSGLS